jgi:hypothetical protein
MNGETFATAVNCMDGRAQLPVIEYLKQKYGVEYVDMITEPAPCAVIAEKRDTQAIESLKRRLDISTMRHGSRHLAIVAHHDCAANPVSKETQVEQIRKAMEQVKWWGFGGEVIGLWLDESWTVQEIT